MSAVRFLSFAFALALMLSGALARAAPPSEATIKAAFIANVVQFTEWPDKLAPQGKVIVCVAGRNLTADALLGLDGQVYYGRSFSVSVRKRPTEVSDCHLLFLAESGTRPINEWLHEIAERPILTVSEADDFAVNGGIVGLYREGNRVAFDVSLTAMRRANLKISAHLLKLARITHGQ